MRRALFGLAFALVLASACKKDKDNTKIIVAVWSDLSVVNELDAVRIEVQGPAETRGKTFPLALGDDSSKYKYSLPIKLELLPEGAKNMTVTVKAVGLHDSGEVVSQTARVSFVSGQALLLKLFLGRDCIGKICPSSDYTCATGACDRPVVVTTLPAFDPKRLQPPDAGPRLDSSIALDGPTLDGRSGEAIAPDLRAVDSNLVEAGADAAPDLPITPPGTGGAGGSTGAGGALGTGGGTGAGGATGSGGTPGIDARTLDATAFDAADAPTPATGGVVTGSGGTTGAGGATGGGNGTAGATGGGGVTGTGGAMETCTFGVSRFGNCRFAP
jgi:hypothetical protein